MDAMLKSESIVMLPKSAGALDIVAEANHRIANNLTLLVSMVRMQAAAVNKSAVPLSNPDVRLLLEGVAARINTIGQLHRMLSHVPYEGMTSLRPHLHEVTNALVAALSSSQQSVRVQHTGHDCLVLMKQVQPLILITCEIFINAMKYAHPSGVPLEMTVDCTAAADGRLVITVSDDGVGLPENFDAYKGDGIGLRMIRSLAAEISASLEIISTDLGLSFRLSLPAAMMAGGELS